MNNGSPRFTWNFYDCSVALPDSATATQRFHQCTLRLPLPGRLSTVPHFSSSLLMLLFVQALLRNFVINSQALQPLYSYRYLIGILSPLLNRVKDAAFAWYSVKIRVIFGVQFERRKIDKNAKPTWKLKHANSIPEPFEYFCQISSKLIVKISSYTVSKLGRFFWDTV